MMTNRARVRLCGLCAKLALLGVLLALAVGFILRYFHVRAHPNSMFIAFDAQGEVVGEAGIMPVRVALGHGAVLEVQGRRVAFGDATAGWRTEIAWSYITGYGEYDLLYVELIDNGVGSRRIVLFNGADTSLPVANGRRLLLSGETRIHHD